ncbi:MAG: hypothetical protein H6945_17675 [Zoogloeaceae bacterium]|nr:hypothetical protein [Rhodocyclaceae bacterium]MCP5237566.1 hypothetical protein [Zoogloeaceae bacterium]
MSETADHRDGRDRIPGEIACLPIDRLPASMISDVGNHCQVWRQGGGFVQGGKRTSSDLVIKKFRDHCSFAEARVYAREHRRLCEALDDMIPATLYVHTRVDGQDSVIAIAETVPTWFNVANPHNEDEAVPLLARLARSREQLRRFIAAAHRWREADDPKVIDLYGVDNLVLDRDYRLRYLDSFGVFFHESLLYMLAEVDYELKTKIDLSLARLGYLEHLLDAADRAAD